MLLLWRLFLRNRKGRTKTACSKYQNHHYHRFPTGRVKIFNKLGTVGMVIRVSFFMYEMNLGKRSPLRKTGKLVAKKKLKRKRISHLNVSCKSDYKSPIKTECGHIFCKACFLDRYKAKRKGRVLYVTRKLMVLWYQ